MCNITYTKHNSNVGHIQKIEVSDLETSSDNYWDNLYSLIKIMCKDYGFLPEINIEEFERQLLRFIERVKDRVAYIIIDSSGLFIKDKKTAESYISQRCDSRIKFTPNSGPILGII